MHALESNAKTPGVARTSDAECGNSRHSRDGIAGYTLAPTNAAAKFDGGLLLGERRERKLNPFDY
jgi:hypothetical protein